jgi:oligopeptide transport system substrate-binding protein
MEQADQNFGSNCMQQYNEIEQQAVNDVAWLPLFQQTAPVVCKICVVGVPENAEALIPPDDWGSIYKTTDPSCANVSQYQ